MFLSGGASVPESHDLGSPPTCFRPLPPPFTHIEQTELIFLLLLLRKLNAGLISLVETKAENFKEE